MIPYYCRRGVRTSYHLMLFMDMEFLIRPPCESKITQLCKEVVSWCSTDCHTVHIQSQDGLQALWSAQWSVLEAFTTSAIPATFSTTDVIYPLWSFILYITYSCCAFTKQKRFSEHNTKNTNLCAIFKVENFKHLHLQCLNS